MMDPLCGKTLREKPRTSGMRRAYRQVSTRGSATAITLPGNRRSPIAKQNHARRIENVRLESFNLNPSPHACSWLGDATLNNATKQKCCDGPNSSGWIRECDSENAIECLHRIVGNRGNLEDFISKVLSMYDGKKTRWLH